MSDKALYANDLIHRFASHTFTETVVNSETKVEFKDGGSVVIKTKQKINVIDAYKSIRQDLLQGDEPAFLSTTTERDALSLVAIDEGVEIDNITIARNELFDGTAWKPVNRRSAVTGITASTTQTQGNGVLTGDVNVISTVANINDTVTLRAAVAGVTQVVFNDGTKKIKIFPDTGDNLGFGLNSSVSLAAGSAIIFHCFDATNWVST